MKEQENKKINNKKGERVNGNTAVASVFLTRIYNVRIAQRNEIKM